MCIRDRIGAPCWVDLWTSDVEGSRRFYAELFGWVAEQPDPEHGGYFMFTREGVPIAGGMGDMSEMRADNTWKPYLASDDIEATLRLATEQGCLLYTSEYRSCSGGERELCCGQFHRLHAAPPQVTSQIGIHEDIEESASCLHGPASRPPTRGRK